jgi:hypothetical protein
MMLNIHPAVLQAKPCCNTNSCLDVQEYMTVARRGSKVNPIAIAHSASQFLSLVLPAEGSIIPFGKGQQNVYN